MTIPVNRSSTVSNRLRLDGEPFRSGTFSRDDVRRVLDSRRRRGILRCVLAADDPIELQTLVGRLADAENDPTVETTLLEQRQRVHVSLCRTHLPMLEEYGLVAYDRLRALVAPGTRLLAFESRLDDELLEERTGAGL